MAKNFVSVMLNVYMAIAGDGIFFWSLFHIQNAQV